VVWFRALAVIAYAAGFAFAWRCWATASEPVRALWWLSAASGAFWAGRFFSRIVGDHSRRRT
jgi:hypothetical protein